MTRRTPACGRSRLSRRPPQARPRIGGLGGTESVPPERAGRRAAASSVAHVLVQYAGSLRSCITTSIAPRRRAPFRQALLPDAGELRLVADVVDHVSEDPGEVVRRLPADRVLDLLDRRDTVEHVVD